MSFRVLISTVPFGQHNRTPIDLLDKAGISYQFNPFEKKLSEEDLSNLIPEFDALIAGTEPISARVLDRASKLKIVARVGIGLDNVDLVFAKSKGIQVSFTPDAPSPAVAELTIGLMLDLLRGITVSDRDLRKEKWRRIFGRRLSDVTIGLVGLGRIGRRVVDHLSGFGPPRILANDINEACFSGLTGIVEQSDKAKIYRESDIVSLHVPLTKETIGMITSQEIGKMKPGGFIVNTSRGGIVDENDLFNALAKGRLAGAAVDVFENEPYCGPLLKSKNTVLTAHMGSMTVDCRAQMEIEATQEVIRFATGKPLTSRVPESEFFGR
ncbi:phosphoglycerate dehydrogenase [Gammaproteobacteria bacterium]|nr:phosphoglycerate dehydrogenase [Gammaproteobacteria bacterium]MDC3279255.1 phosphoglycerate dehydrogenase [Gammaproteobacteria bacterium]